MNMEDVRTFKTYNFVTGAVDGTMAYDFSNPLLYPEKEEEVRQAPEKKPARRPRGRRQESGRRPRARPAPPPWSETARASPWYPCWARPAPWC